MTTLAMTLPAAPARKRPNTAVRRFAGAMAASLMGLTVIATLCVNFVLRNMTAQDVFGDDPDRV